MTRIRVSLLALLIAGVPLSTAAAAPVSPAPLFAALSLSLDDQRPGRADERRERREEQREAPSISAGDAARRVSAGREGRMLGIRPSGDGFVVRWEYPGGRVSDIRVDGSGRVSGGR